MMLGQKRKLEDVEGEDVRYIDPRQSILTISMCKLKTCPVRRVEPSLRRSVLIFNTLKIVEHELQHEGVSLMSAGPPLLPVMNTDDITLDTLPEVTIPHSPMIPPPSTMTTSDTSMITSLSNIGTSLSNMGVTLEDMDSSLDSVIAGLSTGDSSRFSNMPCGSLNIVPSYKGNLSNVNHSILSAEEAALNDLGTSLLNLVTSSDEGKPNLGNFSALMETNAKSNGVTSSLLSSDLPTYTPLCSVTPFQPMDIDPMTLSELTDTITRQTVTDFINTAHFTMPFTNLSVFRFNDTHFDTGSAAQKIELNSTPPLNSKLPSLNTDDLMHSFTSHNSAHGDNFLPMSPSQCCKSDVICDDFDSIMQVLVGT